MEEAWVFDAKSNEYLNQAYLLPETPALAITDLQKQDLQQSVYIKRTSNKIHKIMAATDADNITFEQRVSALATATRVLNEAKKYVPAEKQDCVPPVHITEMDRVAALQTQRKNEGLMDLSMLDLQRKKKAKRKLFTWESERDDAMSASS
jgi:hypothetical protein